MGFLTGDRKRIPVIYYAGPAAEFQLLSPARAAAATPLRRGGA
jgi:hypothetical protein